MIQVTRDSGERSERTPRAESRLGEPRKQNGSERRARLGCRQATLCPRTTRDRKVDPIPPIRALAITEPIDGAMIFQGNHKLPASQLSDGVPDVSCGRSRGPYDSRVSRMTCTFWPGISLEICSDCLNGRGRTSRCIAKRDTTFATCKPLMR